MNITPKERQIQVLNALIEGCSIRSTERMTGVHRDTIMRLLVKTGDKCQKIMDKYPDFRFFGIELKESVSMGLIVTAKSYEEHTKELQHLLDVEVPENSREIGVALQMGDLRENAEYKAAKEKQEILNATAARMKEEIEKSQIFDEKDIDTSKISFATTVTLQNETASEIEEYTILGPWESDPSSKIISYLSPFGSELWHHTIGEKLEFTINDRNYCYTIKGINSYNFESAKS